MVANSSTNTPPILDTHTDTAWGYAVFSCLAAQRRLCANERHWPLLDLVQNPRGRMIRAKEPPSKKHTHVPRLPEPLCANFFDGVVFSGVGLLSRFRIFFGRILSAKSGGLPVLVTLVSV